MKALERTLGILAFLILISQTVHDAYMLWFEPKGSVLDKYDQPIKDQITSANSLDELLLRYDSVRKQADLAKQELEKEGKETFVPTPTDKEPFKSEQALRQAITDWEDTSKQVRELRFYWMIGLIFTVIGLFLYKKWNRWFGLTLLIAGFSEFVYWTSPTLFGASREFNRLLVNKLAFSAISLVLLIFVIWLLPILVSAEERTS